MWFNIGAVSWGVGAASLRRNIFVSVPSRSERDVAVAPDQCRLFRKKPAANVRHQFSDIAALANVRFARQKRTFLHREPNHPRHETCKTDKHPARRLHLHNCAKLVGCARHDDLDNT
jgi:hypothetical protein